MVLAVARYDMHIDIDVPVLKALWLFAARHLNETRDAQLKSLNLYLSTISSSKLQDVTVVTKHKHANILMPVGACVVDLQWLVYTIQCMSPPREPRLRFKSSAEVRLYVYKGKRQEDLSMLQYSQAQSKFALWDAAADGNEDVYVGKYKLTGETTHQDQTQQSTALNHAYLKFMYAQYKAHK
jgi:hypothetical protein